MTTTFKKGEFVAVIGKSTLLRLVANLEEITQGELLFDRVPAKSSDANVKIMYQDSRLLPWKKCKQKDGMSLNSYHLLS
ncbi:ATP-binding cassette domain-containing protein [Solibacillus cecembensis]|uniref:ATP-binding cassette domain-containing protein n=1 Tax=Solibacillus cecembensis TaxID=459347 RepID=UPI003D062604